MNEMKDKYITFRTDDLTKDILKQANQVSRIPISEIVRSGALVEANRLISMFEKTLQHVTRHSQQKGEPK